MAVIIPLFNVNPETDLLGTFNSLVNQTNDSISAVSSGGLGSYLVVDLPVIVAVASTAFALDGRMLGENSGAGSGCPVFYSGGAWRNYYNCAMVQA